MKCPNCDKELTNETVEVDLMFPDLNRPKVLIVCKLPCGFVLNDLLDLSQMI